MAFHLDLSVDPAIARIWDDDEPNERGVLDAVAEWVHEACQRGGATEGEQPVTHRLLIRGGAIDARCSAEDPRWLRVLAMEYAREAVGDEPEDLRVEYALIAEGITETE